MLTWLAGLSGAFQALWLPIALLSGAAMGALLAGGFSARAPNAGEDAESGRTPAPPASASRPFAADQLDLEAELHAAVRARDARAVARHVRLEVAVQPGLHVRADPAALRAIVADLLDNAIGHAEGGRVLLGAGRHGGHMRITVVDDGLPLARVRQEAELRDAERLVALQGGTLEINVRPGAGTTVAVRLPEPAFPVATARTALETGSVAAARDAVRARVE